MPRIRPIPKERAAVLLRSLYEQSERELGATPNLVKSLAHRPELLITFANFQRELFTGGALPPKTKQLVALRVAALDACAYLLAQHRAAARRAGLSDAQVAALESARPAESGLFDEQEKTVLAFVEKILRQPGSVSDTDVERLRKWFGEAHLAELVLLAGAVNLLGRFALCFAVETDPLV